MKKILSLIFLVFLVFEFGNMTGFSWQNWRYIKRVELLDEAIRFTYPGAYNSFREFQRDYPQYRATTRYWGSWTDLTENGVALKLLGIGRYEVRLPEEIVIIGSSGAAIKAIRREICDECTSSELYSRSRGIVGIVNDIDIKSLDLRAEITSTVKSKVKYFNQKGRCFTFIISGPLQPELQFSTKDGIVFRTRDQLGFRYINSGKYGQTVQRVSKKQFEKMRQCNVNRYNF